MRLVVLLASSLLALAGCVVGTSTEVEVTTHYTPPPGYRTTAQLHAAVPDMLYLPRNQISRGPESWVATGHIYGDRNWAGGFCLEQWRNGVLVYMCTTRRYLDPQPFGVLLPVRKMPPGFCGLEAPVYFAGRPRCDQRSGTYTQHYRYRGRPQHHYGYGY